MKIENYTSQAKELIENAQKLIQKESQQVLHPAHILIGLAQNPNRTLDFLFTQEEVSPEKLIKKSEEIIKKYPKSDNKKYYLATTTRELFEEAESLSKELKSPNTELEHIFAALLTFKESASEILKNEGFTFKKVKKTLEALQTTHVQDWKNEDNPMQEEVLKRYTVNLNKLAQSGRIDPVIGREEEIRQVTEIISRRRKNNPVLVGEPGVGKTAIAEGLAQKIIEKNVPQNMFDKMILRLDLTLLIAGTKYQGEFEERLKKIVKAINLSKGKIILFIDEIHTLIGAGSSGTNAMDAANILKPALARGELRTIGATTLSEYQQYIEKDRAFERRFQPIIVNEPSKSAALAILRGIKPRYETYHGVRIKDDALVSAVQYAKRYINNRYLPDSAIDVIDQACARRRISISSMPPELEKLDRKIRELTIEKEAMRQDKKKAQEEELLRIIGELKEKHKELKAKWQTEKHLIQSLKQAKKEIQTLQQTGDTAERNGIYDQVAEIRYGKIPALKKKIEELNEEISKKNEKSHFLKQEVDQDDIIEVIAHLTNIPINKLLKSEQAKLLALEDRLKAKIVGQDKAISAIANAVRRSRAGIQNPNRPIGTFIFLGSTGVGKTALSQALASTLFDDPKSFIRIDLSEYQEQHTISRLIGAPPGYIGYEQGGQLTEAVRHKPHSVILLDEIEKAHKNFFNLLLPVLDEGHLTDNKGRFVNFKNSIIIMTSNLGSHLIQEQLSTLTHQNQEDRLEKMQSKVLNLLHKSLPPEFLNRIDETLIFNPINQKMIGKIVAIKIEEIQKRLEEREITLLATENYKNHLAQVGYDPQFGARPLERLLQDLLSTIAKEIIANKLTKQQTFKIDVDQSQNLKFQIQ